MPNYKKDINTTAPVAVRQGQSDYHCPGGEPWHTRAKPVGCPDCHVVYIVDEGFSHDFLLAQMKDDHENKKEHAPFFSSEPAFTTVTECKCV